MEEEYFTRAQECQLALASAILGGLIANTNIPEATPMSELVDRSLEISELLIARLCKPGESSTQENQATLPLSADV